MEKGLHLNKVLQRQLNCDKLPSTTAKWSPINRLCGIPLCKHPALECCRLPAGSWNSSFAALAAVSMGFPCTHPQRRPWTGSEQRVAGCCRDSTHPECEKAKQAAAFHQRRPEKKTLFPQMCSSFKIVQAKFPSCCGHYS